MVSRNTYQGCQLNVITTEDIQETVNRTEGITEENRMKLKTILEQYNTVFGVTGVARVPLIKIRISKLETSCCKPRAYLKNPKKRNNQTILRNA